MDDRRLSLIVVPDGELETRTFNLSYGKLKLFLGLGAALLVVFIVMVASWWSIAAQAARVPALEAEVARLEDERAKVAELAQTLSEVEAQYERVRQLLGADAVPAGRDVSLPPIRPRGGTTAASPTEGGRPSAWPLTDRGFVTRELLGDAGVSHPGLDIAIPQDSYIRAAGAGTVRDAGTDEVYGTYVLLDHGNGFETMYGHASRSFVQPGQQVDRHEVIALSGSTGLSTAPHLHFEIRKDGAAVDPLAFVRQP